MAQGFDRSSPGEQKTVKVAKFIAADTNARKLGLANDGTLPTLVLNEADEKERAEAKRESSNPWLLIGALSISIVSSIAMLLIDAQPSRPNQDLKQEARETIVKEFLGNGTARPAPYQDQLRRALQAHDRADLDTERKYYREVSEMLHADNLSPLRGLTGDMYHDDQLKELLSILLN